MLLVLLLFSKLSSLAQTNANFMVLCSQVHFVAEGYHKRVTELHEIEENKSETASRFLNFLSMHAICLWGDVNFRTVYQDFRLKHGGKGKNK